MEDEFTRKWKFSYYLLTLMLMDSLVKFCHLQNMSRASKQGCSPLLNNWRSWGLVLNVKKQPKAQKWSKKHVIYTLHKAWAPTATSPRLLQLFYTENAAMLRNSRKVLWTTKLPLTFYRHENEVSFSGKLNLQYYNLAAVLLKVEVKNRPPIK